MRFLAVISFALPLAAQHGRYLNESQNPAIGNPTAIAAGAKLYATSCTACHGPDGRADVARLVPPLAGQPAGYLAQQMLLFKIDTREPSEALLSAKKAIMRITPDSQFPDLAAYYSSLR